MKVIFWGRAAGCSLRIADGPVRHLEHPEPGRVFGLTGIARDPKRPALSWAPSGNAEGCDPSVRGAVGPSFVVVNEGPQGGIGLFTHTGAAASGKPAFFRQYDKGGHNAKGANRYIQGTFVAFRFAGPNMPLGWSGTGGVENDRLVIESAQKVKSYRAPAVGTGKGDDVVQAKQQLMVTLLNRQCNRERGSESICQVQYMFHPAIMRSGVSDWSQVSWFQHVRLIFDPAQARLPVLSGPIAPKGQPNTYQQPPVALWTSQGDPTQHAAFESARFSISISRAQFIQGLKLIAARMDRGSETDVPPARIQPYFGSKWNDFSEWRVLSVHVAQEVHNPAEAEEAYIGGGFTSLVVGNSSLK
jgi:hypothetical protein